jgi:beta-fructofuranosidase/levanase/fructan beta-fructosidase
MRHAVRIIRFCLFLIGILFLANCKQTEKEMPSPDHISTSLEGHLTEPHRPLYHFTPPAKWMNDPNGMVYYAGEYHLFYQYYPDDIVWGPMHWGHAVTTDLINWKHLPIGLYPDSLGYIFSGSAVIDWNNTSGFGKDGQPPKIAIFTHHDPVGEKAGTNNFQYQSIAFSNDKGRSWIKYAGNPVVPNPGIRDFRDPKVIWDIEREQWVMVFAAWDHVKIYTSKDLKSWEYKSDFGKEYGSHGGVWECPDLFPLQIDGTNNSKWVLLVSINPGAPNGGSGTQYFIGDFDGNQFTLDPDFAKRMGIEAEVVPKGNVFADFESTRYNNWEKEGFAFGNYPAKGSLMNQSNVSGYTGERLVNSFFNGDETEGKLTSPTFEIKNGYINFLIGGGMLPGKVGIDLIINGAVVKSATGKNDERLRWQSWNVQDLIGKKAKFVIYDQSVGAWGHILVDQIMFADSPAKAKQEKAVWLDYGRDNYAGVTWSDIPKTDGRRIFMGWMSNWAYAQKVPTESWRSAMTIARELQLKDAPDGIRLYSSPVKETENLRGAVTSIELTKLETGVSAGPYPLENGIAEIELDIDFGDEGSSSIELEFSNAAGEKFKVGLDQITNTWFTDRRDAGMNDFSKVFAVDRHIAPVLKSGNRHQLHIFLDVASIEVFGNMGLTTLTDIFFPSQLMNQLTIACSKGKVDVSGNIYSLKSANFVDESNVN